MMMNILEITDRDTGEVERFREGECKFWESISIAAIANGMTTDQAYDILADGQELGTVACIRRFQKAGT